MGPLVYTSGNSPEPPGLSCGCNRFNGAAGLHQRKPARRFPARRSCATPLQWGRWFTPAETRPVASQGSIACRRASMGPLVYTSGNLVRKEGGVELVSRFNGAAGLHQRKRGWRSTSGGGLTPLQWGRWFTPAETDVGPVVRWAIPGASMGPLVYTSGNPPAPAPLSPAPPRFNGAAGLHQRKRNTLRGFPSGPIKLQWGRWFTPAETGLVGEDLGQ